MLTVIVADDSKVLRKCVVKIMTDLGITVVTEASNGKEAIFAYERHIPDFITMDITMPDMDGIEAAKSIKKFNKNAKILMLTSWGEENVVMNALKVGISGYILKPVTTEKLESAIVKMFPIYEEELKKIKHARVVSGDVIPNTTCDLN